MENFDGIVSLLIACIEMGFIVNLLIFAEKNFINKLAIGLIALLFGYQLLEFIICFSGIESSFIIYLAYLDISLLPPLGLFLVLRFYGVISKSVRLIFLPTLFFTVYYPFILERFAVTKCTVLYATYNYPLGYLYGTFYYLHIIITIIYLSMKRFGEEDIKKKKLNKILLLGYLLTFTPGLILAVFIPGVISAIESVLCKLAFILASFMTVFALKNKTHVPIR